MIKITTEIAEYKGIPYILFYDESVIKQPLMIIAHGFNNDKFEGMKYALKLAQEGVSTLCLDLSRQGDRYDGFMEHIKSDLDFGNILFSTLEESSEDIEKIIDLIKGRKQFDSKRIGITGISHGANLSYYMLKKNSRIKLAVPILGAPNFEELLAYSMEKELEEFLSDKEKELLDFVRRLNPKIHIDKQETRPLFMINGKNDEDIPCSFAKMMYESIKERYQKNNGCLAMLITEDGHHLSDEMIDSAIEWIKINL